MNDITGFSNGSTTGASEGLTQYMHYVSGSEWVPYVPPKTIAAIDLEGTVGRMKNDVRRPWGGELMLTLKDTQISAEALSRLFGEKVVLSPLPDPVFEPLWTKTPCNIICDYHYANGTTTITWLDGTKTTCHCDPDKADQYTGFMIALAKHAYGNHNEATNRADYWINKKPEMERKAEAKRIAKEKEEARIDAKRKERRAKNRIRRAAIRRAEEYQAKKIANEKYGVPMDFKE